MSAQEVVWRAQDAWHDALTRARWSVRGVTVGVSRRAVAAAMLAVSVALFGVGGWVAASIHATDVAAARAQAQLRSAWTVTVPTSPGTGDLTAPLSAPQAPVPPVASPTTPAGPSSPASAQPVAPAPPLPDGAFAQIVIPAINLDAVTVQGVAPSDLARGPGHYPGSAAPGQGGVAAFAGHRTSHGGPFRHLDALQPGDLIVVTDTWGRVWTYKVDRAPWVAAPTDAAVLHPLTGGSELVLTTCTPLWTSTSRLVVHATLVTP